MSILAGKNLCAITCNFSLNDNYSNSSSGSASEEWTQEELEPTKPLTIPNSTFDHRVAH